MNRLASLLQCVGNSTPQGSSSYDLNTMINIQPPSQISLPRRPPSSSSQSSNTSTAPTLLASSSSLNIGRSSAPNQAFLELCINTGEHTKTLSEIELSGVGCDGELFNRIRSEYSRLRRFRSRIWLIKPSGVHFVKVSPSLDMKSGLKLAHITSSLPFKTLLKWAFCKSRSQSHRRSK